MGRDKVPWPQDTRRYYQEIYNECLRVEAMLETCLAENELDNPWLFELLLPKVAMRVRHVCQAASKMILFAPQGQGRLPKWFHIVNQIVRISQIIIEALDSSEMARCVRENRFVEVARDAKSIIQASQYIRKALTSVPMEYSKIVMTVSGFREVVINDKR